ncbi:hypothetical protein DMUE_3163 [Dictyocoela muelleri]|nr:hypothetical protein DMUE_3163 [Dictyocoela muelleri]
MANNSCLNNKQIISEIFKNLDESEISFFSKQKSLNRTIFNVRQKILNNYDNTDDIPEELKLSINGGKFLHYDSGCLDSERLLIFIHSEKIMHLKNSSIWLGDGTFKMAFSFLSDLHNLR